jgi:DNA-binding beta-propeller fold protein YncE
VDAASNEVFVADTGNQRIVVFDAETGAYKRHWGAYGAAPGPAPEGAYDPNAEPAKQFRSVSCVSVAKDGHIYVCDRQNNRIQVFRRDGTYVKEAVIAKTTLGNGSVWDVAFSADAEQRWLFVADGQNQKVHVLVRDTLTTAGTIGAGGRWPGHFYAVGSVAVDSRGNLFTGEALEGKRLQKFLPRR